MVDYYDEPGAEFEVTLGLGILFFMLYSVATFHQRGFYTYFFGSLLALLLLFAAFFVYPDGFWPKSLVFKTGNGEA